jgi:hypothetical protein
LEIILTEHSVRAVDRGMFVERLEALCESIRAEALKEVEGIIKGLKRKEGKLVVGSFEYCSENHREFCDCSTYNEALLAVLAKLSKEKEEEMKIMPNQFADGKGNIVDKEGHILGSMGGGQKVIELKYAPKLKKKSGAGGF